MPTLTQLAAVSAATKRIHSAEGVEAILHATADEARNLIGAHQCVANLVGPEPPGLMAVSMSAKYAPWRCYDEPFRNEGIYTEVLRQGRTFRLSQAELEAHEAFRDFGASKARHPPMRGWLAVPLMARDGAILGMVQLSDREEGDFTADDQAVLEQLSGLASLAVENALNLVAAQCAETRLRRFLDFSLDLICTVTNDGRFQDVSSNCAQILGYRSDALIGRRYIEFVHPEDRARTVTELADALAGRATRSYSNQSVRPDGTVAHLHWSCAWSESDRLFYCVVRDLTEQVKMERKLGRASQLEALGQLTGGIAHDFNNLLTVILGSTEALADALEGQTDLLELAQLARGAGERGAELTSRLLAFARRQPLQPRHVDVAELIASLDPLIRRSIGDHIETRIRVDGGPFVALVDPPQLETAILNLAINARDAMPNGGRLTLRIAQAQLSESDGVEPGLYILISLADTGEGMSPEVVERAFEPFFTTKPAGAGNGLGLSMVYGFIKQSDGVAKIESQPGRGTTVRLYLPLRSAEPTAKPSRSEPALGGNARILVVEDDPLVRTQVVRQLKSLGYSVSAEANGRSALRRLARGDRYDLMFTDVLMPGGMDGRKLAREAQKQCPELRILLTSGYTADPSNGVKPSDFPMIAKPYSKGDLARQLLDCLRPAEPAADP